MKRNDLQLVPVTLDEANAFVAEYHRHSHPLKMAKFAIGLADEGRVRGVAIVGRPVARHLCDGWTLEVNRLATDGVRNGCSMLYGASWRATRAIGYRRLITYTLDEEGGASLRASGWQRVAELSKRKGWDTPSRERDNNQYLSADRVRWQQGSSPDIPPVVVSVPNEDANQYDLFSLAAGVEETPPAHQPGSVGAMPTRRSDAEAA